MGLQMKTRVFSGTTSNEETAREKENRKVALKAAEEAIVLLKNEDNVLPLAASSSVALYGRGVSETIKGGTGSGDVNERKSISIYEGVEAAGFHITNKNWITEYHHLFEQARLAWRDDILSRAKDLATVQFFDVYAQTPFIAPTGALPEKTATDTAIYVLSRVAGEGADRSAAPLDYYLGEDEEKEVEAVCANYEKVVLIVNAGGPVDMNFTDKYPQIKAILFISQLGMEGGTAVAKVLNGTVTPSGKLTDTWAMNYEDCPAAATFSSNDGDVDREEYCEGIYVGYRYFDTLEVPVRYPFGYGLSYTTFEQNITGFTFDAATRIFTVSIAVKNTGSVQGRDVVEVYSSLPIGKLDKEFRRLVGFGSTGVLAAGESANLEVVFGMTDLVSYDDQTSEKIVEAGNYGIYVGESIADATLCAAVKMTSSAVLEKLAPICEVEEELSEVIPIQDEQDTRRVKIAEFVAAGKQVVTVDGASIPTQTCAYIDPDTLVDPKTMELVNTLTDEQLAQLASGDPGKAQGVLIGSAGVSVPGSAAETSHCAYENGIASIVLADGPAGLRLTRKYFIKDGFIIPVPFQHAIEGGIFGLEEDKPEGEAYYQYCTAIPVGTALAQTWDVDLIAEVGHMIGTEMVLFDVTLWLAPGMNIHRDPLCGRNFEYYSEDPLVAGTMAAAMTKGVQSVSGMGTTIKHFAANSQENNRMHSDSVVSERALREIYLRGFEIAVKTAAPLSIMTSYNKINGIHAANNFDLCTKAARMEWGFKGVIMTDWTTTINDPECTASGCINAGNDLVMPGADTDYDDIMRAIREEDGFKDRLKACVAREIAIIEQSRMYE